MRLLRMLHRRDAVDLVALLVVAIWGTSFSFQKIALEQFDVLPFMCLRYLGMLALSWGVLWWHRRTTGEPIGVRHGDWPGLVLTGIMGYTLYIPLATLGLSLTTAFSNALLIATAPLFAALLLRTLRLEAIHAGQHIGMLVALSGVIVFLLPALRIPAHAVGLGDATSLVAALFFAAYSVAGKPLLTRYPLPAMMAYTLTAGTLPVVLVTCPSLFAQRWSMVAPVGWAAFAWTVILPVYAAWTLWNWTIARIGVARASLFMYLVPVIGGVTSGVLLHEGFGLLKLAGAGLVLAGLALARVRLRYEPTAIRAGSSGTDVAAPRRSLAAAIECGHGGP